MDDLSLLVGLHPEVGCGGVDVGGVVAWSLGGVTRIVGLEGVEDGEEGFKGGLGSDIFALNFRESELVD